MPPLILSVEDHPLYADALMVNLLSVVPLADIRHVTTLSEARSIVASSPDLDLIILDLCLPDARGFEALIEFRRLCPRCPILVLSAYCDDSTIRRGAHFGAAAFVSKCSSRADLLDTVQRVLNGESPLAATATADSRKADKCPDTLKTFSPQQLRVLQLICQGLLNKQIAHQLRLSEATIKSHLAEIMHKLGVSTRTQVVAEISRAGLRQAIAFVAGEPSQLAKSDWDRKA